MPNGGRDIITCAAHFNGTYYGRRDTFSLCVDLEYPEHLMDRILYRGCPIEAGSACLLPENNRVFATWTSHSSGVCYPGRHVILRLPHTPEGKLSPTREGRDLPCAHACGQGPWAATLSQRVMGHHRSPQCQRSPFGAEGSTQNVVHAFELPANAPCADCASPPP